MVIKKLNKKKVIIVLICFLAIVLSIVFAILDNNKKKSIEYKLETIGYSETEIIDIKKYFDNEKINTLLNTKYSKYVIPLSKEKYFKFSKLNEYLEYYDENEKLSPTNIIIKVNTNTQVDFYDKVYETDISKNELMMVNKVYKLNEDYAPNDLELISSKYAYSGKYISKSIYDNVTNLIDSASEAGFTLIVTQGYRSYIDQKEAYDTYKMNYGIRDADAFVARPGHSDYQTGFSLMIEPYNKIVEDIPNNPEHIWLLENAYKYGFILRYPEGKEEITGFKYDPWRLRYVGIEAAKYIYENKITFEEYYGYIID